MKIISKTGDAMLSGSIGEPDVKNVGTNNKLLVKFQVRVFNENIDGEWKSEYANVDCWGDVAELAQYFTKGDIVFVCGKELSREYNGKTYTSVKADFIISMTKMNNIKHAVTSKPQTSSKNVVDDDTDFELPI